MRGVMDNFVVDEDEPDQMAGAFFAPRVMTTVFGCCGICLKPSACCHGNHDDNKKKDASYVPAAQRNAQAQKRQNAKARQVHAWKGK